jgi:ribosome biogenesis GTPase A
MKFHHPSNISLSFRYQNPPLRVAVDIYYGDPIVPYALSITAVSPAKKSSETPQTCHCTPIMSLCSRGAILRNPKSHLLRLVPKPVPRSSAQILLPRLRISPQNNVFTKLHSQSRCFSTTLFQRDHSQVESLTDVLPVCCPGCGAFSQTVEENEPGYYKPSRKQTRKLLAARKGPTGQTDAQRDETIPTYDEDGEISNVKQNNFIEEAVPPKPIHDAAFPDDAVAPDDNFFGLSPDRITHVCDRCHDLVHHNKAVSSPKPTILSIRNYLEESPYKHNRVYHIIDAADFPMSLVPKIHWALMLQEQRSRNRRAPNEKYQRGKKLPTISFIITRSDLLAATKDQVDSKMEYIRTELRAALGRSSREARLGNVHMISAHRGWWTKEVKEEIREHGGGIWVVGKANVGKSSFIEACFPKDTKNLEKIEEWMERRQQNEPPSKPEAALEPDSLLPPAPPEDLYPVLPVVSSLPGTTVSPIRIPFGRGKGEMIDLPGLERGLLEDFVQDEHKRDLIMTKRIKPERCTIKPGQSLLLGGGLIRITPVNPSDTVMSAGFLPLESHITNTQKAIETQSGERPYRGTVIMKEGVGSEMSSAGKFDLKWDTTISNLPTSLAKAVKDRGIPVPPLPYRVMSADILIEGCGWVELSIQIRSKRNPDEEDSYPQVEVFSPHGKHVGSRRPIECWNFIAEKQRSDKRKRPRLRR